MKVFLKPVELPLDRLRFDPDPLDWNGRGGLCNCMACQLRRDIAREMGVPVESIVGLTLTSVAPTAKPAAAPEVLNKPRPVEELPPAITGFDVHGAPERNLPPAEAAIVLPPWLIAFTEITGRIFGWCVGMFYVAVLAPRRERRRLLRVFRGE